MPPLLPNGDQVGYVDAEDGCEVVQGGQSIDATNAALDLRESQERDIPMRPSRASCDIPRRLRSF